MTIGLPKISLRWLILFVLFAVTLAHMAATYFLLIPAVERRIEDRARLDLSNRMAMHQGTLETFLHTGDMDGVRHEVAAASAFSEIRFVLVIDDRQTVIAASDLRWLDRPLSELDLPIDPGEIISASMGRTSTIRAVAPSLLVGFANVYLGTKKESVRELRSGTLIIGEDTQIQKNQSRRLATEAIGVLSILLVVGIAAIGLFIHMRLTRRVERLLRSVGDLAAGNLDARSLVSGKDEIGALGAAFDGMAELLQERVRQIKESETRMRLFFERQIVGMAITSPQKGWLKVNDQLCQILGYSRDELDRLTWAELTHPDDLAADIAQFERILAGEIEEYFLEKRFVRKNGEIVFTDLSVGCVRKEDGSVDYVLALLSDITQRKQAEAELKYFAHHDPLTGLPNRLLFQQHFHFIKAQADRLGSKIALLFIDLDNFKAINDTLGHAAGDGLLKEAASRLLECVRESDALNRHGGDEFLMAVSGLDTAEAITSVLLKILDVMQLPIKIEEQEISLSVSIGVAIYPDDGVEFRTLLQNADTAMYQAKDAGRNTYRYFDESMHVNLIEYQQLRVGLRHGLENNEFILHYQPQIDLASHSVIGVEALLRWNRKDIGLVSPGRFIPVAEDSGLIVPIGEWVLGEACRQAVAWSKDGMPAVIVAVNLSAVQFRRGNLEQTVTRILDETGLDPSRLELELTESILINNTESVLSTVERLKRLGVRLSIDDFGTGYSSLAYLKRFSVDKLKIDQSFVRDIVTDPNDAAIVRAIVQMAHSLNLRTIAEGVETVEALEYLRSYNCDEVQGYYFAKPIPADAVHQFIVDHEKACIPV